MELKTNAPRDSDPYGVKQGSPLIACLPHQPPLGQRRVPGASDDEVIVYRHAHQLSRLHQLPRDADVFARGLRVAWSRVGGAVPAFRLVVSPNPLPEPDVRLSAHPALHLTR